MKIIIINTHDEILDIINKPLDCLVNFDWHPDYPEYGNIIDIDYYARQIDKVYYEENWVAILASKGFIKKFTWIFPHDDNIEESIILQSSKGNTILDKIKFNTNLKVDCEYVTIDMDFFGSRIPINWSPGNRNKLFKEVLSSIQNENATIIISKSKRYTNYDVDEFIWNIDI